MRTHCVLGETRSVVGLIDGDVYINNNTAIGCRSIDMWNQHIKPEVSLLK